MACCEDHTVLATLSLLTRAAAVEAVRVPAPFGVVVTAERARSTGAPFCTKRTTTRLHHTAGREARKRQALVFEVGERVGAHDAGEPCVFRTELLMNARDIARSSSTCVEECEPELARSSSDLRAVAVSSFCCSSFCCSSSVSDATTQAGYGAGAFTECASCLWMSSRGNDAFNCTFIRSQVWARVRGTCAEILPEPVPVFAVHARGQGLVHAR